MFGLSISDIASLVSAMSYLIVVLSVILGLFIILTIILGFSLSTAKQEKKGLDKKRDRDVCAAYFAGAVTNYCDSKGLKDQFGISLGKSPEDFFFVAYGPGSDNVVFRIKDGDKTESITVLQAKFDNVVVYSLADSFRGMNFIENESRPDGIYLSVMPEGHPEFESFFLPQVL